MNILIKNSSIKYMLCYLILLLTNSILMWNFNLSNKDNYVNILILSWYINFIVVISGWIMYKTLGNSIGLQHIVILICFLLILDKLFCGHWVFILIMKLELLNYLVTIEFLLTKIFIMRLCFRNIVLFF